MSKMTSDEVTKFTSELADSVTPSLLNSGYSLALIVCNDEGWVYCLRGKMGPILASLEHVAKTLENADPEDFVTLKDVPNA